MKTPEGIVCTPEEALEEVKVLLEEHLLRGVLSNKVLLKEKIDQISAVLSLYEAYKPKEVKNGKEKGSRHRLRAGNSTAGLDEG